MKPAAHGFTLIELMIIVAIIGILAAVALPAYQRYAVRTKVSEAVLALGSCRTTITEMYQVGGTGPGAGNWGCEGNASSYVSGLSTDADGVATVTLTNIAGDVNGRTITMIPVINGVPARTASDMGKGITAWICGGAGTSIALTYLPSSCRGT